MKLDKAIGKVVPQIRDGLAKCFQCPLGKRIGKKGVTLAGKESVRDVVEKLVSVLFPGCQAREPVNMDEIERHLTDNLGSAAAALKEQVRRAYEYQCEFDDCKDCDDCAEKAARAVERLVLQLPATQQTLQRDILAAYEGDPAARSTMEVVMSYPGLYAIVVHRLAHVLYEQGVPLIPRIMSEHAHSLTGIDIHPGAKIGPGFFIDHGTGVVVGETCVIGENVKIYQGVTLGALSFEKDEQGNPVKGIKRHPNVGDNVIIYAGATILGGETNIGSNSEIGGNVWLIHSVPPNSKVYNRQPAPLIKQSAGKGR